MLNVLPYADVVNMLSADFMNHPRALDDSDGLVNIQTQ